MSSGTMSRSPKCAGVVVAVVMVALFVTTSSYRVWAADGEDGKSASIYRASLLPICPPKGGRRKLASAPASLRSDSPDTNLLLVSTLDGKLTALDPGLKGQVVWSVDTAPGSMLSSSISQMEFTNNARWVRLIPSLAGGLYKFDGEVVEPVPIDAESLLKSSFKFADGTVMTGGRESRTYGVELATGKVRYSCSIDGCFKGDEALVEQEEDLDDVIVIRRETQTVRAVEPRSGSEKWNFSVSQHNLELHAGLRQLCEEEGEAKPNYDFLDDFDDGGGDEIKAVVADGTICSVDRSRPDRILWKKQFETPIVHAWRIVKGKMFKVNLFSNSHLPRRDGGRSPLLYLGSFEDQLYIQENERSGGGGSKWESPAAEAIRFRYPRVSWKPYLVSADSRTPAINHDGSETGSNDDDDDLPLLSYDESKAEKTALAVFHHPYVGYPYDLGWYLYPDEPDHVSGPLAVVNHTAEDADDDLEEEDVNPTIQVVFVSLWYWWKEVVFISIVTAILMNVIITRPLVADIKAFYKRRGRREVMIVQVPYEVQVEVPVPTTPDTASAGTSSTDRLSSRHSTDNQDNFVSRFYLDYEPVSCLGAGGFGVVFESKNKLDDAHYAVKRVKLPVSETAKKKVLREVKFLAKLDHKHIVRYFTTWLEYPPVGWQEERDAWWRNDFADGGFPLRSATTTDFSIATHSDNKPKTNDDDDDDSLVIDFEEDASSSVRKLRSVNESSGGIEFNHSGVPMSTAVETYRKSKFWMDSSASSSSSSSNTCDDAMEWDERNRRRDPKGDVENEKQHVYLYIVMQLCQRESLKSWLRSSSSAPRNRTTSLRMFREICSGVEYVHSQGLIHRDLKPGNIFFSTDGTVKIGDFGLVTEHCFEDEESFCGGGGGCGDNQHTEEVGTVSYMSPEQLTRQQYDHKVDVYSLGLVLFELLVPFSTQMERAVAMSNVRKIKFPRDFVSAPEHDLVKSMLSRDSNARPEASEILELLQEEDAVHSDVTAAAAADANRRRKRTSSSSSSGAFIYKHSGVCAS